MKRAVTLLLSCLSLAGCVATKPEPCSRCTDIEKSIRAAESFMPGYWVKFHTEGLEPTGSEQHTPEYLEHRRWIDVRDALNRAEGKVKDE